MSDFRIPLEQTQAPNGRAHLNDYSKTRKPSSAANPGPPQSLESEQSTLGAMMLEASAIAHAQSTLTASDFHRENHRKIFPAIIEQAGVGPVDLITVVEELRRRGQLEEVGGAAYLTALIEACPSAVNVPAYAAVVREMSQRRAVLSAAEEAHSLAVSLDSTEAQRASAIAVLTRTVEQSAVASKPNIFTPKPLRDIFERPRPLWLVRGLWVEIGTGLITGNAGSFKTINTIGISLCIASGTPWHGREVKQGTVVYVVAEGAHTTADHVRAWLVHQRIKTPDFELPENFYVIEVPAQIADERVRAQFLTAIADLKPALVVFDTLAQCNAGRDENSTGEMSVFTNAMKEVSIALNCFVLTVHHNNKEGSIRGSSSIEANTDAHISFKRSAGRVVTVSCERIKNTEFEPFALIGRVVELGSFDEYGDEITSLVFEPTDAPAPKTEAVDRTTATREKMLQILAAMPEGAGAKKWQDACEAAAVVKGSRFYDHRDALVSSNRVELSNRIYKVSTPITPITPIYSESEPKKYSDYSDDALASEQSELMADQKQNETIGAGYGHD